MHWRDFALQLPSALLLLFGFCDLNLPLAENNLANAPRDVAVNAERGLGDVARVVGAHDVHGTSGRNGNGNGLQRGRDQRPLVVNYNT